MTGQAITDKHKLILIDSGVGRAVTRQAHQHDRGHWLLFAPGLQAHRRGDGGMS
jgi:hypothetical protein